MPAKQLHHFDLSRGLANQFAAQVVPEPFATSIFNYIPTQDRGLEARAPWVKSGTTNLPATLRVKGIAWEPVTGDHDALVIATHDGNNPGNIQFYRVNPSTPTSWDSVGAAVALGTAGYQDIPIAFARGDQKLYVGNPDFPTTGRGKYITGTTLTTIATDYTAGRAAAYHLNRWWIGGAADNPSYLKFSEIGDITTWNVSENFIPVGDASFPVLDMVTFDRGMLVGKNDGVWWLGGSTIDSFQLVPISPVGIIQGKTMTKTPYGVYMVGQNGLLYLFDGGDLKPVGDHTRAVVNSVPGMGGSIGDHAVMAWCLDRLYIVPKFRGDPYVYVYVPSRDLWYIETIDQANLNLAYVAATADGQVHLGPDASTTATFPMLSRDDVASKSLVLNNVFEGNVDFEWMSANVFVKMPFGKNTVRSVYVRYYSSDATGAATNLTITVYDANGASEAHTVALAATDGWYVARADFGVTVDTAWYVALSCLDETTDKRYPHISDLWVEYVEDEGVR